jgi:hypothetical protein
MVMTSKPWSHRVACLELGNLRPLHLYGYNATPTTRETIWPPSTNYPWLAADTQPWIVSSDADDDGAPVGNGARTVRVTYLDAFGNEGTEDVTMNGVANVLMAADVRRINRLQVQTCGSYGWNDGNITLYANDAATVIGYIPAKLCTSAGCFQTVPIGYRDVITGWHCSWLGGAGVMLQLVARTAPDVPWEVVDEAFVQTEPDRPFAVPRVFDVGTDYDVWGTGGGTDAYVTLVGYGEPTTA